VGLGIAIVRMEVDRTMLVGVEICPIKIEVFVLVVSLENKEQQNTEARDMGLHP
jgi:hypothetical protein